MPDVYNWKPQRKNYDAYPSLRKRTRLDRIGPPSRRTRMIYKALLRADRRWDAYAARVRSEKLEWEDSRKTKEWRLILQNGRLIRWIRRHRAVLERAERLGKI